MDITPVLMQQKRLGERGAGAETELKGEVKRLKIRECEKINGADYRNKKQLQIIDFIGFNLKK